MAGLRGATGRQSWQVVTICLNWVPALDQLEADGILIPRGPRNVQFLSDPKEGEGMRRLAFSNLSHGDKLQLTGPRKRLDHVTQLA